MNADELSSIYLHGSREHVAFENESISQSRLAESMAAFANSTGGVVIIGIEPRGNIIRGLKDVDTAIDKALAACLRCEPPLILPRPECVVFGGKEILVIQIPAGLPHAYGLRGKYLSRFGKRSVALGPRQLRQLLRERGEADFETLPAPNATLEDLDELIVRKYAAMFLGDAPVKKDSLIDFLYRRGCLTKDGIIWRPTISGCLLFDREPQRIIPSSEILLVRYASKQMTDEFVRETARGPLPEQVRKAEAFIVANIRKGARIDSLQRLEHSEYPISAVREAIVNAVAHRDYAIRGDEIRVLMFSDRIEVYSPGRLPGHVTIDNIVDERFSRNQIITQVLADMGYIERLGYGIDRMIRYMRDWGLPSPRFAETTNGFKVTLRGPGEKLIGDEMDAAKWRHMDFNERQQAALDFIAKNKRITNREYRDLFPSISEETIRRDLVDLVEHDLLLKMGDKRGTFYIFK